MASIAPVLWAQRKDSLFITINVADVDATTAKIELTDSKLVFTGKALGGKDWVADLEFFSEVDPTNAVCLSRCHSGACTFLLA